MPERKEPDRDNMITKGAAFFLQGNVYLLRCSYSPGVSPVYFLNTWQK